MAKNYDELIAAQNESERRIKIKGIINTLTEEQKKKRIFAILSGVCFGGLMVATHFSGIDSNQILRTELQSLQSFDAAKEYISSITPAMWEGMIATAVSLSQFIKHKRNYNKANQEFYDVTDNEPINYLDTVKSQARNR